MCLCVSVCLCLLRDRVCSSPFTTYPTQVHTLFPDCESTRAVMLHVTQVSLNAQATAFLLASLTLFFFASLPASANIVKKKETEQEKKNKNGNQGGAHVHVFVTSLPCVFMTIPVQHNLMHKIRQFQRKEDVASRP